MAEKSMAIALIISFFLTGLGIAYAGDIQKGVIIFVIALVFNILTFMFFPIGIISIILWIYGLYATYQEVNLVNGV